MGDGVFGRSWFMMRMVMRVVHKGWWRGGVVMVGLRKIDIVRD